MAVIYFSEVTIGTTDYRGYVEYNDNPGNEETQSLRESYSGVQTKRGWGRYVASSTGYNGAWNATQWAYVPSGNAQMNWAWLFGAGWHGGWIARTGVAQYPIYRGWYGVGDSAGNQNYNAGNFYSPEYQGPVVPAIDKPAGIATFTVTGQFSSSHVLTWTKTADNRTTGYHVYERVNGGGWTLVDTTTALTVTKSSRTAGSYYDYYVASYNASGDTTNTKTVSNVGGPIPVPGISIVYTAPATVAVTVTNTTGMGTTVAIERSVDDITYSVVSTYDIAGAATYTWTDTAAPEGLVRYRARFTAPATSSYSSVVSQQTLLTPNVPTNPVLILSNNVYTASWSYTQRTNGAATKFRVRYYDHTGSVVETVETANATTLSVTKTRAVDTCLTFDVAAVNERATSDAAFYGEPIYNTTATPGLSVSSYTAPTTVALSLKNNSQFSGTVVVERGSTVISTNTMAAGATITVTDASASVPSSSYRARMLTPAVSAYSATVTQQTISAPDAPTNVAASWTLSGSTATGALSWDATSTSAKPIDSQELQVSRAGGAYVALATPTAATRSYTDSAFNDTGTATYRIRTTNAAGSSAWVMSNTIQNKPAVPTITAAIVNTGGVPTAIGVTYKHNMSTIRPNTTAVLQAKNPSGVVLKTINIASGNMTDTYTTDIPWFDPANKVLGNYTWSVYYTGTNIGDPATVSPTYTSNTVTKVAPVGQETTPVFDGNNTTLSVPVQGVYASPRTIVTTFWPYAKTYTSEVTTTNRTTAQANTAATVALSAFMQKVPYIFWQVDITGKYDDGTTAYTKSFSGSLKKGQVLMLNGQVVRARVIESGKAVYDVFPKVIV